MYGSVLKNDFFVPLKTLLVSE